MLARLTRKYFSKNIDKLNQVLSQRFNPNKYTLVDKSHLHYEAHDSHFDLYIISEDFEEVPRFKR